MSRFLLLIALLIASGSAQSEVLRPGSGETFTAKVIAVLDGDTVLVIREGRPVKVRLAEIDAPEKAQVFGETSKRSLSDMVLDRAVQFTTQAVDKYGRLVAHLKVGELDVNVEQIRRGLAWEYSHFHSNKYLISLENEARNAPRGLWAMRDPIPPWEWRKQHPNVYSSHVAALHTEKPEALLEGCGDKTRCSQMLTCEEAQHYLNDCGVSSLDGNGDGVPCTRLCAGQR